MPTSKEHSLWQLRLKTSERIRQAGCGVSLYDCSGKGLWHSTGTSLLLSI